MTGTVLGSSKGTDDDLGDLPHRPDLSIDHQISRLIGLLALVQQLGDG
jgi:hypothetical protein